MRVLSNAFLLQAELTQADRWDFGPLEIHFVPQPNQLSLEFDAMVHHWNRDVTAGFVRGSDSVDFLHKLGLDDKKNPNIVIAPTQYGYSECIGMLGSLLPDEELSECEITRPRSGF